MKATTAVCDAVGSVNGVSAGRVHKQRRDVENEEVQMYLSKLKELVPFMPKNKRLTKLEVIQHVIDYICDLQCALEAHPNAETLITTALPTVPAVSARSHSGQPRQPLGVLGVPNTIVPGSTCAVQEQSAITVSFLASGVVSCRGGREALQRLQGPWAPGNGSHRQPSTGIDSWAAWEGGGGGNVESPFLPDDTFFLAPRFLSP